jgi:uncharacterized caspase-like protein
MIRSTALLFKHALPFLVLLCFALSGTASMAQTRIALLIGNNNYATAPLRNAVNDARDLSEALKEVGFVTILRENATRQEMIAAIREFGTRLDGAESALFFYAGHAMQFKDRNYLIPTDAEMKSEDDVTFSSVEVSQIFDRMERAKTRFNFIVLDACRDNPFASSFKVSSSGLAQIANAPSGTLVAYATAPGSVAADGFGRNGVYTKNILQQIKVPDLPVEIMFKRVREAVERETKKLQTPWDVSSLKGDFVFNNQGGLKTVSAPASSGPSSDAQLAIEREFWVSVRDSTRAEDIQAYLDKYPSGQYTVLARNRLESILRPARAQVAAAPADVRTAVDAKPADARPPAAGPAGTAPTGAVAAASQPVAPAMPTGAVPSAASPASAVPATAQPTAALKPPELKPDQPAQVAAAQPTAAQRPPIDTQPGREISPGVREVQFPDGSIYRGGLRGTSLHGSGEYVSKDGFKYRGEYLEGRMHGKGNFTFPNGDNFEGDFLENAPSGKGVYKFASGDSYVGEVKKGVIAGRGLYTTKAGDQIDGTFVDGKAIGKGTYKFASGDSYEGEMVQGRLTGKGVFVAKSGDRIEGEFVDGRPTGGIYRFTNGDRYEGEMKEGALSGRGVYFYAGGLKYEGDMVQGKPNGRGTFWFADGSRFEGQFEDGMKRAKGVVVQKDGKKSDAEIVDGAVRLVGG